MTRFLADGQAIRREIHRIFSSEKGRRVALVAFVGKSAEAYLSRPKGIELVCWPHAPGTNASAIKELMRRKVYVRFAERLHMKVYWTATQGAVVASANLSTNAYGAGALREAGVFLPSSKIDIDALLASVRPEEITAAALEKLKRESKAVGDRKGHSREKISFVDWLRTARRKQWLLHCFNRGGGIASQRLKAAAKADTGKRKVVDFVYCRHGEINPEDFVLCLDLNSTRRPLVDRWFFAHRIVHVATTDRQYERNWPWQAGQFHPLATCAPPPFHLDGAFRKAVRETFKDLGSGAEKYFSIERTRRPTRRLLSLLAKHYVAAANG